jgi:hypothetical protein
MLRHFHHELYSTTEIKYLAVRCFTELRTGERVEEQRPIFSQLRGSIGRAAAQLDSRVAAVETAVRNAAAKVLLQFHDPQIAYRKREVKPVYVECRIHNSFLRAHNAGHIPIAYARDEDVQGARILSAIKHSGHCGLPLSLADWVWQKPRRNVRCTFSERSNRRSSPR